MGAQGYSLVISGANSLANSRVQEPSAKKGTGNDNVAWGKSPISQGQPRAQSSSWVLPITQGLWRVRERGQAIHNSCWLQTV